MKKKAMKYRLIKILCVGIIFGALIGMLLMGLSGRARIKEVREEFKTAEDKLKKENVILLYAAKDTVYNHAVILKEWLEEKLNGK